MRIKHALAATTAALFLTVGVLAQAQQTPPAARDPGAAGAQTERPAPSASPADKSTAALPPGALHEIKGDTAMAPVLNVNAKDLASMDVYGADGKKIGGVNKVLGDDANAIKAVTLDVGGFLGIGAREVVLPIDKLQKGPEKNRLQTSLTKDDIEKLEKWEESGAPSRDTAPSPRTAPTAPSR